MTVVSCRILSRLVTLELKRTPKYLRWVIKGVDRDTIDALDQLDDKPADDETIFATKLIGRGTMHIDGVRNGKRFGEWRNTAEYELVSEQPSQEVMRDKEKWVDWCVSQHGKGA